MSPSKKKKPMCHDFPAKQFHEAVSYNLNSINNLSISYESIERTFPEEFSEIEELLVRTFTIGESNSALLISPRGGGKSLLLNAILEKLRRNQVADNGILVNLSGFVETDDRLALKSITRQLQLNEENAIKYGSFAENLSFILKSLQSGTKEGSKPIIFILDEFDLFCHHRNQTLLYNLFDVSQSAQTPICVIGMTSRTDAVELLEKRVKSRFSHREIFLFPKSDFEEYLEVAQSFFKIDDSKFDKKYVDLWNQSISECFESTETRLALKNRFSHYTDIHSLKKFLCLVMTEVSSKEPFVKSSHFRTADDELSQDSKANLLKGLSILQLCLVIAMKHLTTIYDGEHFNFQMVFKEYKKFTSRHMAAGSYERSVVLKAFEQLEGLELISPVEHNRGSVQKEYCFMQMHMLPQRIDETLNNMNSLPAYLNQWCSSYL